MEQGSLSSPQFMSSLSAGTRQRALLRISMGLVAWQMSRCTSCHWQRSFQKRPFKKGAHSLWSHRVIVAARSGSVMAAPLPRVDRDVMRQNAYVCVCVCVCVRAVWHGDSLHACMHSLDWAGYVACPGLASASSRGQVSAQQQVQGITSHTSSCFCVLCFRTSKRHADRSQLSAATTNRASWTEEFAELQPRFRRGICDACARQSRRIQRKEA